MVSKKRLNYHWRLFIPLTAMLWLIIGAMASYQYRWERNYRMDRIKWQLDNMRQSLIRAYDFGDKDIVEFVKFIDRFFQNSMYDGVHIAVYDRRGHLITQSAYGAPDIDPHATGQEPMPSTDEIATILRSSADKGNKPYFYSAERSDDGNICVHTSMPYSATIEKIVNDVSIIWVLVFSMAIAATLMAYISTRHLSRSVYLLRDFARLAASSKQLPEKVGTMEFPHDELGDISRQIVSIYRAKDKALARSVHEHKIAQRANEEKARIKRQVANNLNHELKTPVGIIKGYLDTIISDPGMPDELRINFLKKTQAHTDRLAELLRDVSTITRLDEGASQVELTDFDFHDLAYNLANDLEISHLNGNMDFDYDIPFDCYIKANYTLVSAALLNLVKNAAAYSKGTEITLKITGEDEKFYWFSFSDNGCGVPEQHIPHLFERFYRIDEGRARKSGGTGLGLPIVQSTFTTMGGTISVHNIKPSGLEFRFSLPKGKSPD